MNIAIGADHRGLGVANQLAQKLKREGHTVDVLGPTTGQPVDYPEPAYAVAKAVAERQDQLGILVCGTGIGVSIAANKYPGIRAAVAHDELTAQLSRSHNDANVLCLSADTTPPKEILTIVETWLRTPFEGGRHERRVRKIAAIERGEDPSRVAMETEATRY